jgi:hypothetical protein
MWRRNACFGSRRSVHAGTSSDNAQNPSSGTGGGQSIRWRRCSLARSSRLVGQGRLARRPDPPPLCKVRPTRRSDGLAASWGICGREFRALVARQACYPLWQRAWEAQRPLFCHCQCSLARSSRLVGHGRLARRPDPPPLCKVRPTRRSDGLAASWGHLWKGIQGARRSPGVLPRSGNGPGRRSALCFAIADAPSPEAQGWSAKAASPDAPTRRPFAGATDAEERRAGGLLGPFMQGKHGGATGWAGGAPGRFRAFSSLVGPV